MKNFAVSDHEANYKNRIKKCFNSAVFTYDNYCCVQKAVGEKLIQQLSFLSFENSSILDLGCGTGLITQRLADQFKYHEFHAVDMADQLLRIAKNRVSARIHLYELDWDHLAGAHQFNLIFSNMSLQWAFDLFHTITLIHQKLMPGGIFAFSLPVYGTFSELGPNRINSFYSLKTIEDFLKKIGFTMVKNFSEVHRPEFHSLLEALRSIKAIGAHCVRNDKNHNLFHLNTIRKKNKFYLSYFIGFFIAKKSERSYDHSIICNGH